VRDPDTVLRQEGYLVGIYVHGMRQYRMVAKNVVLLKPVNHAEPGLCQAVVFIHIRFGGVYVETCLLRQRIPAKIQGLIGKGSAGMQTKIRRDSPASNGRAARSFNETHIFCDAGPGFGLSITVRHFIAQHGAQS